MIDKAGHIVTNYHVVQGATKVQVSFSGQDQLTATVVGKDPSTDIAVLKVDAHARALTPLPLGDSDAVTVGDAVYAIGNPFGFTRTLTTGVVSALQRQIEAPNTLPIDHAIQTDAAINHGNSGGPLIDAAGRVIGVTSQISTGNTGQQGNVGIGFAIPINTVRNVAAQIITTGKVEHAFLGVEHAAGHAAARAALQAADEAGLLVQTSRRAAAPTRPGSRAGQTTGRSSRASRTCSAATSSSGSTASADHDVRAAARRDRAEEARRQGRSSRSTAAARKKTVTVTSVRPNTQ